MKRIFNLSILAIAAVFTACEDKIDLDIPKGKVYPVVDAWITTAPGTQTIRISETVPYTSSQPAPVVSNATIVLQDVTENKTYPFTFANGVYSHNPGANVSIAKLGHVYKLTVTLGADEFVAMDTIKRVPPVDSITYEFKKKDESASGKEGYYARFWARDIAGPVTDYYWVRGYRNTTSNVQSNIFAIDGSFEAGLADSAIFIQPIAESITDWDKPFQLDEKVIVRLASLSKPSYDFLSHVDKQVNNGGLFATVLENVGTNLKNTNPASTKKVLGWFGTSAVSFADKTIKPL
ncbi:uncharacterized protein DUF4249 [Chitinophaga skermanii]|uniref:Uncharacterized protein DUF4249 n=1 Tax=Chitinophaga skermanii TaxID=331697 RepID=A0A327Q8U1_9BACT|nr:DUF4249 domain-containing protein [Chitinophaga skermanii]RAJ00355.1 uncharacterized protein DUF4249 [Chitinophaga skermanii]